MKTTNLCKRLFIILPVTVIIMMVSSCSNNGTKSEGPAVDSVEVQRTDTVITIDSITGEKKQSIVTKTELQIIKHSN